MDLHWPVHSTTHFSIFGGTGVRMVQVGPAVEKILTFFILFASSFPPLVVDIKLGHLVGSGLISNELPPPSSVAI